MRALLLLTVLAGAAAAQPSPAELRSLVADSLSFADSSSGRAPEYGYTVRSHKKQFDSEGRLKREEETVGIRSFEDGFFVFRIIERDGKKLSAEESREQEEKVQKRLNDMRSASAAERERNRRKDAEDEAWVREVPSALNFNYAGEEMLDGRRVMVLLCQPRPGYVASSMRGKVLEKLNAKLWIDPADRELVKAEGETFDTVNIGMGVLGKIEKGTKFAVRRTKLPDGHWVTQSQNVRFGARIMLVRWMHNEISMTMSDFRHKSQVAAAR